MVRMAHVLLACPFPAAPYVVLAHAKGEAAPSWVGPQWSDPLWMRWMHHVYTSDDTRWGAVGQYSYASWIRQAALDTALAHGGQVSKRTLLGALTDQNLGRGELSRISAPGGAISKGGSLTRAWHFPLTRVGNYTRGHRSPPGSEGEPGFAVIVCPTCAETATVATRVPEIFGDLLCPNGHMPLGGHDLLAGVVAPDEYQWLRVPRSIWSLRSRGRRGTGE